MRLLKVKVCGVEIKLAPLSTRFKIVKSVSIDSYKYSLRETGVVETSDHGYLKKFLGVGTLTAEQVLTPTGMRALMQLGVLPKEYVDSVRAEIIAKETARLTMNAKELMIEDAPQVKFQIMQLAINKADEYVVG